MGNFLLQTGLSIFLPGYTTYQLFTADEEGRPSRSAAALDLLSVIPRVAHYSRIVGLFGGRFKGSFLEKISEKTGRYEVFLGSFRYLPLLLIGLDFGWEVVKAGYQRLFGDGPVKNWDRLKECGGEFFISAILYGAGQLHMTLVSQRLTPILAQKPLHPGYAMPRINQNLGAFAILFPKEPPAEAILTDPTHLDFRHGAQGTSRLGFTIFRDALTFIWLQKAHLGNKLKSGLPYRTLLGRSVFWRTRSQVKVEGMDQLKKLEKIDPNAVVIFTPNHIATAPDYAELWVLGQDSNGTFNRAAHASQIADFYNYRINPLMRFSFVGQLFETVAEVLYVRRKPALQGAALKWRSFWEKEFHLQDAVSHPLQALRAGILKGFRKYAEKGGRICAERNERLKRAGTATLHYFPHGTRTTQFFDNEGKALGSRILSGCIHQSGRAKFHFISRGTATDLIEVQAAMGQGRPIYIVPVHREGPIIPKQQRGTVRLHLGEQAHLGETTTIRIGEPRLLEVDPRKPGAILDQIQMTMVQTSRIRERLIDLVPRIFGPRDQTVVRFALEEARAHDILEPFICYERILALHPERNSEARDRLLQRFAEIARDPPSAPWDELVLEVNRILS